MQSAESDSYQHRYLHGSISLLSLDAKRVQNSDIVLHQLAKEGTVLKPAVSTGSLDLYSKKNFVIPGLPLTKPKLKSPDLPIQTRVHSSSNNSSSFLKPPIAKPKRDSIDNTIANSTPSSVAIQKQLDQSLLSLNSGGMKRNNKVHLPKPTQKEDVVLWKLDLRKQLYEVCVSISKVVIPSFNCSSLAKFFHVSLLPFISFFNC
jgi:hypothetical protein